MVGIIEKAMFGIESKLRQFFAQITRQFESFVRTISAEDETIQSSRVFYLLTTMLLISLILLSPDKIPQIFAPSQIDSEMLGKMQGVLRVLKKLMPI